MAWLMSEARVMASIDVAETHAQRAKGLLGRHDIEGAFAIPRCRWVHTLGMRFDIDVAFVGTVDGHDVVVKIDLMRRRRLAMPVLRAHTVIEARAGAFERWGLKVGDPIEIRLTDADPRDVPRVADGREHDPAGPPPPDPTG
jgi:uncharacterized membrane protein (UPF0127 family)